MLAIPFAGFHRSAGYEYGRDIQTHGSVSDQEVANIEQNACPTCGCCSGMFTANSMNCLNEAIGLALPGNGTIVATHENRTKLFEDAAKLH